MKIAINNLTSCLLMSERNKNKNILTRLFRPRDLMLRDRDRVMFCALSPKKQEVLFLLSLVLIGWGVFTSVFFMRYNSVAVEKSDKLRQAEEQNADLQGELSVLADHVDKILARLGDRTSDDEEQPESNPDGQAVLRKVDASDDAKTADVRNTAEKEENAADDRLKNETLFVRERIRNALNGEPATASEKESLSFHRVMLQRDIAVAEAEALQEKVGNLEKLISGMQEAQILAFRKMASLADDGIHVVEAGLADVKQSLAGNGVSMDRLLDRIRQDKENVGIGGPFIPSPMPGKQHDLNISLVGLNQRLDHWYDLTTLQNSLPLGKPVDRIRVTSSFGSRGDPFQGGPAHHEAVDLGGMIGEPIYATAPGKVVRTGNWGWYGNMVEIDHGLGFRTRYAHMEKVFVTKGETVRVGDKIGTLGNTGRSTGPHLHYEIRIRGIAVDPMKFIKARKNVFKS